MGAFRGCGLETKMKCDQGDSNSKCHLNQAQIFIQKTEVCLTKVKVKQTQMEKDLELRN